MACRDFYILQGQFDGYGYDLAGDYIAGMQYLPGFILRNAPAVLVLVYMSLIPRKISSLA